MYNMVDEKAIEKSIAKLEEAIEMNNMDIKSLEEEQKNDCYIDNTEAIEEYKKANTELRKRIKSLEKLLK